MRSSVVLFFLAALLTVSHAQERPPVLTFNIDELVHLRASHDSTRNTSSADSHARPDDAARILRAAERALLCAPLSVTMKDRTVEGATLHDYVSLAPYWWPNPKSANGLPYVRRDGEVNPERELYKDREHFRELGQAVNALAQAYYITHEERYADHAARLLAVWFLDDSTRMNPSLNFAQAVRGRNTGRGAGLIEMHGVPRMLDAIRLLDGSRAWTPARQRAMEAWCAEYYTWLTTSPIGLDELDAPNNHGSWYDVQRAAIAVFLGRKDEARQVLESAKTMRIAAQIEPDGTQPKELVRTKSMGYSTFNLTALSTLATIGSNSQLADLWQFATPDGRSIKRAIEYMVPFYDGTKKWELPQIAEFDWNDARDMLRLASPHYSGAYNALIARIDERIAHAKKNGS